MVPSSSCDDVADDVNVNVTCNRVTTETKSCCYSPPPIAPNALSSESPSMQVPMEDASKSQQEHAREQRIQLRLRARQEQNAGIENKTESGSGGNGGSGDSGKRCDGKDGAMLQARTASASKNFYDNLKERATSSRNRTAERLKLRLAHAHATNASGDRS